MDSPAPLVAALAVREAYRDEYWRNHDPILEERLLWRAQTFRHTVHLLPAETILELGCGDFRFTRALLRASRGENPICAATFQSTTPNTELGSPLVEWVQVKTLPGPLEGRSFDYIVGMDLLDRRNSSALLAIVYALLRPGGEIVFYESNPWNPVRRVRAAVLRVAGKRDPRSLINRPGLYELLSEIGFVRIYAVFNDFVFAPLSRSMIWFLRNLSILLENAPAIRRMAGSILVHAQKPPRLRTRAAVSLFQHESLRRAISVVIPCRNEEMNAGPLIERLLALFGEYIHEVIPVNDGSTDRTAGVLDMLARRDGRVKPIHRQPPHGVGLAIRDGLAAAEGEYVLSTDCDFQHLLPEFRDLLDAVNQGYDVVIGSRFSRLSVLLNYPFLKIVANRAFHTLFLLLFGRRMRDVTNNLKIMRRRVVKDLRLLQPGFAVNAETGLQPLLMGYNVREVPISWINRSPEMGTSSFHLMRVGGGYWQVLAWLWVYQLFGLGPYRGLGVQTTEGRRLDELESRDLSR